MRQFVPQSVLVGRNRPLVIHNVLYESQRKGLMAKGNGVEFAGNLPATRRGVDVPAAVRAAPKRLFSKHASQFLSFSRFSVKDFFI
jgi:hypothetical protein